MGLVPDGVEMAKPAKIALVKFNDPFRGIRAGDVVKLKSDRFCENLMTVVRTFETQEGTAYIEALSNADNGFKTHELPAIVVVAA